MSETNKKQIALALDTSTPTASVAIAEFDKESKKLLFSTMLNVGLTHSQTVGKLIESALTFTSLKPSDIDLYVVVNGPGSFTGLRIGIATIEAMADSQDKPLITISSLEALSKNIKRFDGIIVPIIDARRTNVYGGIFDAVTNTQILEEGIYDISELIDKAYKISDNAIFIGDGTYRHASLIQNQMPSAQISDYVESLISAKSALDLGIDKYLQGNLNSKLVNYVKATSAIPQSQQKKKW